MAEDVDSEYTLIRAAPTDKVDYEATEWMVAQNEFVQIADAYTVLRGVKSHFKFTPCKGIPRWMRGPTQPRREWWPRVRLIACSW